MGEPDFEPVRLASTAPFTLGPLHVRPATRQVINKGRSETLEPRVMQVLVLLAGAQGGVVSRAELFERCWEGRIVGENAINRVISRVRALGAGLGERTFGLETITKVGYRLVLEGEANEALSTPSSETHTGPGSRRWALVAGGAAVAALAGGGLWLSSRHRAPSAAAVDLYRRGLDAQRQGLPDQTVQAVNFLQEAVRLEPGYADAWGALALSYRHRLENDPTVEPSVVAGWIYGAAERALQIDPDNADAHVAKLMVKPHYRNWAAAETSYRAALKRYPDHWLLRGTFGRLMFEVGRWNEGLPPFRANIAADPFLPVSRSFLAYGLWNSGRLQEAESTLESAFARWPAHPTIWFQRFFFLVHTGRAAAAIAFAENVAARPLGVPADAFAPGIALARALATGSGADVEAAVKLALERARRGPEELPSAIQTLSVLGEPDAAFDLLGSYFLERPSPNATLSAIGPLTRRGTDFLFARPLKALRADARFTTLVQAIGLEGYWRATGSVPDYRRNQG